MWEAIKRVYEKAGQSPLWNSPKNDEMKDKALKMMGPAFSAMSPLETAVDFLIRKDNGSFTDKLKGAIQRGGDIPGALESRGMNKALAYPLGMGLAVALPGSGEIAQGVKSLANIDELSEITRIQRAYDKNMMGASDEIQSLYKKLIGDTPMTGGYKKGKITENAVPDFNKMKDELVKYRDIILRKMQKAGQSINPDVANAGLYDASKLKIDEKSLQDTGWTKVDNGNTSGAIEDRFVDEITSEKYLNGDPNPLTISTIESKTSKTGSATDMVKQIQSYAKDNNRSIIITPDARPSRITETGTKTPLSQTQLEAWYEKLGFKKITSGEEKGAMYWNPETSVAQQPFEDIVKKLKQIKLQKK